VVVLCFLTKEGALAPGVPVWVLPARVLAEHGYFFRQGARPYLTIYPFSLAANGEDEWLWEYAVTLADAPAAIQAEVAAALARRKTGAAALAEPATGRPAPAPAPTVRRAAAQFLSKALPDGLGLGLGHALGALGLDAHARGDNLVAGVLGAVADVAAGVKTAELYARVFCEASPESYELPGKRHLAIQVIVRSIGAAAVEEGRCTAEEAARLCEGAAAEATGGGRYTVEESGRAALAFAVHEALKGFELPGADGGTAVWRAIEARCPSDARDGVETALEEASKLTSTATKSRAVRRAARLLIGNTSKSNWSWKLAQKSLANASLSVVSAALHSALGVEPYAEPGRASPYEAGANDGLDRVREAATERKAAGAVAAAHV
jgi:hypothetical protein